MPIFLKWRYNRPKCGTRNINFTDFRIKWQQIQDSDKLWK